MHKIYPINVFSKKNECANRCEVYCFSDPMSVQEMLDITSASGLSEIAFIKECSQNYSLRIFSPKQEMTSCTHAILASLYVFHHFLNNTLKTLIFNKEPLFGKVTGNNVSLPINKIESKSNNVQEAKPNCSVLFDKAKVWTTETSSGLNRMMIEKPSLPEVMAIKPNVFTSIDFELPQVESYFVYCPVDNYGQVFYGRMFAPKLGIKEDPVNGNSCIALFWEQRRRLPNIHKIRFLQNNGASLTIEEHNGKSVLIAQCYAAFG